MDENSNWQNQNPPVPQPEKNDNIDSIDQQPKSAQVIEQPKTKKNKVLLIIGIILLIVLSAAGGIGVYAYLNKDTKQQAAVKTSSEESTTKTANVVASITPVSVTDEVKKSITAIYPDVITDKAKVSGSQIAFVSSDSAPAWTVNNSKNYVGYSGDGASGLEVNFNTSRSERTEAEIQGQAGQIIQTIIDVLNKENFVLSGDNAYKSGDYLDAYIKDDVVCVTYQLNDNNVLNSPININCGNLSKYTTTLSSYVSVEPFAKAYTASVASAVGVVLGQPKITDSKTSGYKTAVVSMGNAGQLVGGFAGLFYQKDGGDWKYFTGTQGVLGCDQYNTPELKAAYKGETCYSGNVQSTVQ